MRLRLLGLVVVLVSTFSAGTATAGDGSWAWPANVDGPTRAFDAPDSAYAAGHRGVDLPTPVGAPVTAVASGVVSYVGTVAGTPVITIDHGAERSTFQPVSAAIKVGQRVDVGDVIGRLALGPFHCAAPCLHLGRIRQSDDAYLDPFDRLPTASRIRLVDPDGPPPVPPAGSTGSELLRRPVGGPVTSRFGARIHPLSGEPSQHDGVDFGAPCGAVVHAAGPGTVAAVRRTSAYGLRVVVRHADGYESSYSHLQSTSLDIGDEVNVADEVGKAGSSGLSTGCHVHFGVRHEGVTIDPLTVL